MCTHLFIVYAFDLFHLDLSTKKGSPMQQVVASGCPGPNIISAKGTRHCGRCPDGGSSRWEYDHPQKNNDFCHCHKRKRTFMAANHVWGLEFGWNVQEVKICFIFFLWAWDPFVISRNLSALVSFSCSLGLLAVEILIHGMSDMSRSYSVLILRPRAEAQPLCGGKATQGRIPLLGATDG